MEKTYSPTEFGALLQEAINNKKTEVFEWKFKDGKSVSLNDMSVDSLQKAYSHTLDMLYNTSRYTPGKYQVKKNIKTLINDCNAELLLRYIKNDLNVDTLKSSIQIIEFIKSNPLSKDTATSCAVIFPTIPKEFQTVTIDNLLGACLDKASVFNRKMIPQKFIISQGIWLTPEEKEELTEYDENNNIRPWLDVIKERLLLGDVKLRISPKGLSYKEFRSLVHLDPISKISKLTTATLHVLRDKILLLLDVDIDYYIEHWTKIQHNIEKVAKQRNITLDKKSYK